MLDMEFISELIRKKEYENIFTLLTEEKEKSQNKNILKHIFNIYNLEKKTEALTIMDNCNNVQELIDQYIKFKFYIWRTEFEQDNNESELLEYIEAFDISVIAIVYTIDNFSVCKEKVFNKISVMLYSAGHIDYSISILTYAYNLNSDNEDTIYNLAYILHKLGYSLSAHKYLSKIKNTDTETESLRKSIEGAIDHE